MFKYTTDEMKSFVEAILPESEIIEARKKEMIMASRGEEGQEIISYEVDKDGKEYIELRNTVAVDPNTGECGWVVTKCKDGQPVFNKYGHFNQYIIADGKFKEMYELVKSPNFYQKMNTEKFIKSPEDIVFETKYGPMTVYSGGYIKVSDLNRISAISDESFKDTYEIVN